MNKKINQFFILIIMLLLAGCAKESDMNIRAKTSFEGNKIVPKIGILAKPKEERGQEESSKLIEQNVDVLAHNPAKNPNVIIHENAIWNITSAQANQTYTSGYIRGDPTMKEYTEEAIAKRFLENHKQIEVNMPNTRSYTNDSGDSLSIETNPFTGRVEYRYDRANSIAEENRKKISGITMIKMKEVVEEELKGYFSQKYLAAPRFIGMGDWNYDKKAVLPVKEFEESDVSSNHFMLEFEHIDDQSVPFSDMQEGIRVLYFEDGVNHIVWTWHDFSPSNEEKIHLIPIDEALSIIYKAMCDEARLDAPEKIYVSQISMCYTNMTTYDFSIESDSTQYDLHWEIKTSYRNYWVNCVTREVYFS